MMNPKYDENGYFINETIKDLGNQLPEVIDKMHGIAIEKGIIKILTSDPVIVRGPVIDYEGAGRIEELEKEVEYLKKMNADLHTALSEFYEKSKPNTFLKRENS